VIIDNVDHYTEIVKSLDTIDGLTTVSYAHGTNVIYIAANWKESEFDNKIKEVENTPNVKNVKITGKHRAVKRSIHPNCERRGTTKSHNCMQYIG
jgi:hypothetical protein